jgi:hypothetical protein
LFWRKFLAEQRWIRWIFSPGAARWAERCGLTTGRTLRSGPRHSQPEFIDKPFLAAELAVLLTRIGFGPG